MSCGSCRQEPIGCNTDKEGTLSCNRNNNRCGDETACMYYNRTDGKMAHYNYVAVQGAGDPDDPRYRCAYKAYDYYNDQGMYGDHALGCLGTYSSDYGQANRAGLYGEVDYSKCNEHGCGKRDMCDDCGKDYPNFARHEGKLPFGIPDYLDGDEEVDLGLHLGGYGFDLGMQRWLLLVVVVALLWYMKKEGQLPGMLNQLLSKTFVGYSVMNMLIAVAVIYFVSFFF